MKSRRFWAGLALCLCGIILMGVPPQALSETAPPSSEAGYLQQIGFDRIGAKERVTIALSRQSGVKVEAISAKSIVVRLDNLFVPQDLRKPLGEGLLGNVLRATPVQKSVKGASPSAEILLDLKERVPYNVKQEGNNVILDFNVAALAYAGKPAAPVPVAGPAKTSSLTTPPTAAAPKMAAGPAKTTAPDVTAKEPARKEAKETADAAAATPDPEVDAGPPISVDFQDADIRAVLRLLGEQANRNIVVGPEVKGTITVTMKNVPWTQVLDTILEISGLAKYKESDNVIGIMSVERLRKNDADRVSAAENRRKVEEANLEAQKKQLAEKGKSRQLLIEAKIVEASESFLRTLGVQWGASQQGNFFNGDYSYGVIGGSSPMSTPLSSLSTGVSLTQSALALNLPTAFTPSIGIITGGANAVLSAKLSALETTSTGKVISSPRVLTTDNEKALIEQGEQIPVVTPATTTAPATTTYKDAVLRLEVTPKIIPDDHIFLTITAKNDRAIKAEKDANTGNMPLSTSKVDSKVAIRDGDTIVIGGILKTEDTSAVSGVPWLSKIPILGWLFKMETITKTKRELLIFVTPRLIKRNEQEG